MGGGFCVGGGLLGSVVLGVGICVWGGVFWGVDGGGGRGVLGRRPTLPV